MTRDQVPETPTPWTPLIIAFFCSGAAGLVYQVLWVRQLTLVMGSTVDAVSTVLATFMAGLGLGSLVAARFVDRLPRGRLPRLYVRLEVGIAAFGLALPLLLRLLTPVLATLYRVGGVLPASRFLTCALLLLIPTTLMGATLPVLTSFLRIRSDQPGRLGQAAGNLYAANTLGAMVGSLAAGVVLLNLLGMRYSNGLAVVLNLVAAGLVFRSTRHIPLENAGDPVPEKVKRKKLRPAEETHDTAAPWVILSVIALSGLGALMDEVAWTRTLILLIGPTTYGFSFVVTSVIAGIALGSAAGSRWTARTGKPAGLLGWVEIAAGLVSIAVIRIIGLLPVPVGELIRAQADHMVRLLAVELFWIFLLLLLPSFLFGVAFPLAVRLLFQSVGEAGKATGRVYAWNTFGAVAGSLVAGFVVLPRMGLETTLYAAAIVHLAAGVLMSMRMVSPSAAKWRAPLSALTLGVSILAAFVLPKWDRELLSGGMYKYAAYLREGEVLDFLRRGELIFYKEGKVTTVSVKRVGSEVSLAIDGKVDATNAADMLTQRLLAHVPLLLHPAPRNVCVIGYGSGVTAGSALTHSIESLEAIEISPEVIEASSFFETENHHALENERLRLFVTDARNHLLLHDRSYDVIISEPSNPWMAGVSQLFTRDFFALAKTRLAANGLFCQWAHIYNMAEADLKTIVGSFTDTFRETALFMINQSDILLVGARDELPTLEPDRLGRRLGAEPVRGDLEAVEVRTPAAFASLYTISTPALSQWASGASRHTDDRPVLEFRAPRHMHDDTGQRNRLALAELAEGAPLPDAISRLRADPSVEDLLSRALMLEKSESLAWAFETYVAAARKRPESLGAYEGVVRTAITLDQPQSAEETIRAFIDGRPDPPTVAAHIALALLYRNTGRFEEALRELEIALGAEPENTRALLLAAEVEGEVGLPDRMEDLARRAAAVGSDDPEAHAVMAEAALRRGELELALSRARSILERHPDQTRAMQVAAIAYAQMKDYDSARSSFRRLIELEPNAYLHFDNFARMEMERRDFRAAADLYEQSVDINPRNVQGYVGLRDAARMTGNTEQIERASSMLEVLGAQS